MKRFITQLLIFSVLAISIGIVLIGWKADGYTDPFYMRFTTSKKSNLIIGTSRAAQGLQPKVFRDLLNKDFFNYSFTVAHSPFGSIYLESIKKKIKKDDEFGVYIVAVDPWSISSTTFDPNDSINFRENKLSLGNTKWVNVKPNIQYLFNNFNGKYYELFFPNRQKTFLHDDGWFEVTVSMDSIKLNKRISNKIKNYKENNLSKYKYSSCRFDYLINTINYLKQYGEVYLVRLPIHPKMMEIEEELMPDFNRLINNLSSDFDVKYLDMTPSNSNYLYTDGNHLYKSSGKDVSLEIAQWILD